MAPEGIHSVIVMAGQYTSNELFFTVTPFIPLKILSPNGGEMWKKGTTQTIRWSTSEGIATSTKISVRLRNTVTNQEVLAKSVFNTGSTSMTIPTTTAFTVGAYRAEVKMGVNGKSYGDSSDKSFCIIPSGIQMLTK